MSKRRLEAFSDGVFAIIITIMVLELKVPRGGHLDDLLPLVPVFLSYVQSFLFIGNYWMNHHRLIHAIKKVSSGILFSNLSLLFCLSLVPFATGWAGETGFSPAAVAVYAVILILPGIAYIILVKAIQKTNTWNDTVNRAMDRSSKKGMLSLILYLFSIPLAFISPVISEVIFLVVAIFWIVPDKVSIDEEKNLIHKAYHAFNARNIDEVLLLMHSNVHWPNGWEGGYMEGHNEVRNYWIRQWSEINTHVEPVSFKKKEDGRFEVEVYQVVKDLKGKLISEGNVKHIYIIDNGLIKSMEIEKTG